MKVRDLIETLKTVDQDLEVCRGDHQSGDQLIETVEITTAVAPSVKYVRLN